MIIAALPYIFTGKMPCLCFENDNRPSFEPGPRYGLSKSAATYIHIGSAAAGISKKRTDSTRPSNRARDPAECTPGARKWGKSTHREQWNCHRGAGMKDGWRCGRLTDWSRG